MLTSIFLLILVISGYLTKKGHVVKNWKTRFFVLKRRERIIRYYNSREVKKKIILSLLRNVFFFFLFSFHDEKIVQIHWVRSFASLSNFFSISFCISVFKDGDVEKNELGSIQLSSGSTVIADPDSQRPLLFRVICSSGKDYSIEAHTPAEKQKWVIAIRSCV